MSDGPCNRGDHHHAPRSLGILDWCPGDVMLPKDEAPCLPTIGESCGDCHRCRDTAGAETRHCDGCGQDYDPFEESHVGHEGRDPETAHEALADVCRRSCVPDKHDPVCRILQENLDGPVPLSDEERAVIGEVLHREGFYAPAVRARILDVFDATLAVRRGGGGKW